MNARVALSQSDSTDAEAANSPRSLGIEFAKRGRSWRGPHIGFFLFGWIATESGLAELGDSTAALIEDETSADEFGSGFAAADVYVRGLLPALLHRADEYDLACVLVSAALLSDTESVERAIALLSSLTYLVDDELSTVIVPLIEALELLVDVPFGSDAADRLKLSRHSRNCFAQRLSDTLRAAERIVGDLQTAMTQAGSSRELVLS